MHDAVAILLCVPVCLAVAACASRALAASGDLDPTFGSDGRVSVPVAPGTSNDRALALALEPGGAILAVGYAADSPRKFAATRLLAQGTLDGSLAGTGMLVLPIGTVRAEAHAVARAASATLVLAGFAVISGRDQVAVVRLSSSGSIDGSFAGGQPVTVPFGTRDARARAVAVRDDQTIVVGGWVRSTSANRDSALVQLEADGALDPAFGNGGKLVVNLGSSHDEIAAIAIDGEDRIVVAGYAANGGHDDFLVARFLADGTLDLAFNGTGRLAIDLGGDDEARALALTGDGRILVAGTAMIAGTSRFAVARVEEDGSLDPTFGDGGIVTTSLGTKAEVHALAVEASGRFFVAGSVSLASTDAIAVAQYRTDGSLAPNFGAAGVVTFHIGNAAESAFAAAVQEDGHLVVAGAAKTGSNENFGLARLLVDPCGNGVLDPGEGCDPVDPAAASCCSPFACQVEPAETVCRAADGACDAAEACDGIAESCPADAVLGVAAVCRPPAGICDVTEFCTGSDKACPIDSVLPTATVCRAATDACDAAETCDGSAVACPADRLRGAETICRDATDLCDVAEQCTGESASCPPDAIAPEGAVCRPPASACDAAETCDGAGAACPEDGVLPASTPCRAAAGICDVAEECDGASALCPDDGRMAAGTECRTAAGACDVAEVCDGLAAACPDDLLLGAETVCRPSADVCDAPDRCSGDSIACPADRQRRDKDADGVCDLADVCPRDPDPVQRDGDSDGIGDACDLCTSTRPLAAARIHVAGYDTPGGDDTFKLEGEIAFDAPPALDPETTGIRILIRDGRGKILYNLVIPEGARDPVTRVGWRRNASRGLHAFNSPTLVRGVLRKVKLVQPAARPGVVKITATGRKGSFATLPVHLPLTATAILDPSPALVELCGEAAFPGPPPAPACAFDEGLARLSCE